LAEPKEKSMKDDLEKFIEKRKRTDPKFARNFEPAYQQFKFGTMLRQARKQAGGTCSSHRSQQISNKEIP